MTEIDYTIGALNNIHGTLRGVAERLDQGQRSARTLLTCFG
jgi:hypothetical protein